MSRASAGIAWVAAAALLIGCGAQEPTSKRESTSDSRSPGEATAGAAQLERLAAREEGSVYYLGDSFEGLPLTHAERSGPMILLVYGECNGKFKGDIFRCRGHQVQLQQTAIESPARYETPWRGCVRTTVRGVPAAQFDGFELYTGDSVVTIYAAGFAEAKRAAAGLRAVGEEADGPLAPPTIDVTHALRQCALESVDESLAELRRTAESPLYWVGDEFEGHPLGRAEGDGRWARFVYGECVGPTEDEDQCWPPLTVEVQPVDRFRPSRWARGIECRALDIRGAAGALLPSAHGLTLYTGQAAIRLQGEDLELLDAAATALRRLDEARPTATLPPPPDAVEQELRARCAP